MSNRLLLVLLLALAGCTTPAIPEGRIACATSDDCPSDYSCRANRCYSTEGNDAGNDAHVDAGDSGQVGDAGPGDAGPSDAGAGCNPSAPFMAATTMPGLDTTELEYLRSMSADEDTAYFHSKRTGTASLDLWTATRASAVAGYTSYTSLPFSSLVEDDVAPGIDPSGTLLAFITFSSVTNTNDLAVAERSAGGAWPTVTTVVESTGSGVNEMTPFVAASGNIYFVAQSKIFVALRNGAGWSTPIEVPGLSGITTPSSPVVDAPERVIYFSSEAGGTSVADIYVATRANTNDPFVVAGIVPNVNSAVYDFPAHISADGCRLYLTSNRTAGHAYDGFVATRGN